ncbi:MAG: DNA repair protein RecN [Ruminococcus sp.]|nr:DNA repair protein RecN [Ruminococcus sp.]
MLREIYIKNLAVIKEAVIPLAENLNIFTGETGAGKSILINGINAVLGQRVTKDIVRTGCDRAVITALFTDLTADISLRLDELGISHENDEITLTREISRDGRSVARINQRTASATLLKEIGGLLINIHGQHDNQILLDSECHMNILDDFGTDFNILESYRHAFRELQQTAKKLNEIKKSEHTRMERRQYLNGIIEDIGELELDENEDDIIEKEYETAKNAEKAIIAIKNAIECISGEGNSADMVATAENEILRYTAMNDSLNAISERLSAVEIELSDISTELENSADKIELDGQRLEYLGKRLNSINKLKRKYALDCSGLVRLYNDACTEIINLESSSSEIQELTEKKENLLHIVTERARELFECREKAGRIFAERVTAELEFLNMPDVVISVSLEMGKLTMNGMDSVEFLISANKGEIPKPISKIASGGELSRIMLALKSIIAEKDSIPTMIFDEIDTGVSGRTAQKIGIKLKEISRHHQVICVTHLSQIAVMADNHLMIEKKTVGERTETSVTQLDGDGRVAEIARIMGGENPSVLMLDTAREELEKYRTE